MEKIKGCTSCKEKELKFSSYEKKMIWIGFIMIFTSIYGLVSIIKDIISIF
jgi:hypothetical protein